MAQALNQLYGLPSERRIKAGHLQTHDCQFLFEGRIADEQIQATALEGLRKFTCIVGCEHYERLMDGAKCAQLRNTDLEVAQDLKQEGFKFGIRPINFVN